MLRLSEACRPRHHEVSIDCIVRPISVRPSSALGTAKTSGYAYVNGDSLRRLGIGSGAAILITTTCYKEQLQVAVRLQRMDDCDDLIRMQSGDSGGKVLVLVPRFIYIQLTPDTENCNDDHQYLHPNGLHSYMEARCCPLLEREIKNANSVDLKLLAKCDLDAGRDTRDHDETPLPLPLNGSLLWLGAMVPVVSKGSLQLCTYRVGEIEPICSGVGRQIWRTNATTSYKANGESSVEGRLPPLTETVDWLLQRRPTKLPSHLDISYWLNAFKRPCCESSIPLSSRIWHVVGEHVDVPIRVAADRWGYPLKIIHGLAATAFFHGHVVTMAGMADKLAGLNHLGDQSGPCIVLIHEVDAEFRTKDERHRFWDVLTSKVGQQILVVLHTRTEDTFLPDFQVFPTFYASLPDAEYAEFLWNEMEERIDVACSPQDCTAVRALLQGRPDHEIACLHNRYRAQSTLPLDADLLGKVCTEFDSEQRKKSDAGEIPAVHWDDVGGVSHVRNEIMDAIELPMSYPGLFRSSKLQCGILLYGPPGTGKTLIAKAVATECRIPFLSVKGPELLGSYVGESEANLRSTFAKARQLSVKSKPMGCVLFFDELDSLAPRRGESASNGNVMDRVVATLFSQLDSRDRDAAVFCIGATNRPDLLDPALLRPGRFNRLVYLGVAAENQSAILKAQLGKLRLDENIEDILRRLPSQLPKNLTGADLASVVSGAVQVAMERLCNRADQDLQVRIERGEVDLTIDDVLESWPEHDLQPTVTYDDLIQASRDVTPSVSESELRHYESLRDTYETNRKSGAESTS